MMSLRYVLALVVFCGGCAAMPPEATAPAAPAATVSGKISYRERIALPPDARVIARLVDVSKAGAPATVLGEQVITTQGRQVPFAYAIEYDPRRIDPRFSYAVQARIEMGDGSLRFISDTHYPVLTRGAGTEVDLVLVGVRSAPR